jgi:hypothetical protein
MERCAQKTQLYQCLFFFAEKPKETLHNLDELREIKLVV